MSQDQLSASADRANLLKIVKNIHQNQQRGARLKDIEQQGITIEHIQRLFGSLGGLLKEAGCPTNYRKKNMSDEELKRYIESIRTAAKTCPSLYRAGTICFEKCHCWLTDKVQHDNSGRPRIRYKNKTHYLYQVAYLLYKGEINTNMCILHSCDNPACFNPEHLRQGTDLDNAKDRVERNKPIRPVKNKPLHKLKNPYDYEGLLTWIKANSEFSPRGEWLYQISIGSGGYPHISIGSKQYRLHRLVLANKLGLKYDEITVARHRFPDDSPFSGQVPERNDVNPEHLVNGTFANNTNDAKEYSKGCSLSRQGVNYILNEAKKTDFVKISAMDFDMRLASELDVSALTIRCVRTGRTYLDWHEEKKISAKEREIVQLTAEGQYIASYPSIAEAARTLGIGKQGISKVVTSRQKLYAGYMWVYATNYKSSLEKE